MRKKATKELEHILLSSSKEDIGKFLSEQKQELLLEEKPFAVYLRECMKRRKISWREVFLMADVDEEWGYRVVEERERTRQRDLLLRIFYAAEFELDEVQRALRLYGMAPLIEDIRRDAILIIAFNTRPGNILDVNKLLRQYGEKPLRFLARAE